MLKIKIDNQKCDYYNQSLTMMQTVNASLMKATVQDMQTYLHHLERLLGLDLPHRLNLQANLHQSVSYNMEQPQNEQSVLVTHLERLSQSIHGLDRKIDSHMTAISELSNRIAQVEESQQELLAQSNNIPCINMNNGYQFDSPLLSATIADDCTLLSSSADAIFSSDSMQSITVCKMDAPVNEIIIPSAAEVPIVEAPVVEVEIVHNAPVIEAPVVEISKVTEVPVIEVPVVEVPKVIEVPKVTEVPITEAPVIEIPIIEAPKVTEAPKVEVLSVESNQEADGEEDADGEEVEEVEEEEVVEEQEVEEITYNGETYYKDADGFIYKPEDDTPIGYWKEKTQSIAFYRTKK
jgi:hypothetical protein